MFISSKRQLSIILILGFTTEFISPITVNLSMYCEFGKNTGIKKAFFAMAFLCLDYSFPENPMTFGLLACEVKLCVFSTSQRMSICGCQLLESWGRIGVQSTGRAWAVVQAGVGGGVVVKLALQGHLLQGDRDQRCGRQDLGP